MTTPDIRRKVILETSNGKFVKEGLVPPFDPMPDVIVWGQRMFQFWTNDYKKGKTHYREAFAFWLPVEKKRGE